VVGGVHRRYFYGAWLGVYLMKSLDEIFSEKDGVLYHKSWKKLFGLVAGHTIKDGYQQVRVNGKKVFRHRVIWEMNYGPIPDSLVIDHINGIPGDDRIENLQVVTRAENHSLGISALYKSNSSGFNGVVWYKQYGKWSANFRHKRKPIHCGYFDDPKEASEAILKKRIEIGAPISRRVCK
jgi:hypothetical protein